MLNSASSLSYYPFWWSFDKKAELNGEAFFEGEHAKNFTITSDKAETTVLGTSFNIYARDNDYQVTCVTGKVKVLALISKDEVDLTLVIHEPEIWTRLERIINHEIICYFIFIFIVH